MNENESNEPDLMDDEESIQIIPVPESLDPMQQSLWELLPGGGPPAENRTVELGESAILPLVKALNSNNEVYCYNAAICMMSLPEPHRTEQLVSMLEHSSLDARSEAIGGLGNSYDPNFRKEMVQLIQQGKDHWVRGKLAMILAREKNGELVETIQEARSGELDTDVLHNFDLALSRLGDPEARHRIAGNLNNPIPRQLVGAIRDYIYIGDISSLQDLRPLLNRSDPLMNARPAHSNFEVWLRTCDIAAEVVIIVADLPLGKEISNLGRVPLSQEQIEQVKTFLDSNR